MIGVTGEAIVTVYLNCLALYMVLGLCVISRRIRSHESLGDRIFLDMCIGVIFYAVTSCIEYLIIGSDYDKFYIVAVVCRTLSIISMLVLSFQWLLYVDYMIYGSRDYLFRKYWKVTIPLLLAIVIVIIIMIDEIYYYQKGDGPVYFDIRFFYLVIFVMLGNFIASIVIAVKYNREVRRLHFFHVTPVIIPYTVGMFMAIFSPYCAGPIGYAIGMTFIYFSLIERWRYDDPGTGFYNKTYLSEIIRLCAEGRANYTSAIRFDVDRSSETMVDVLTGLLPRDGEVVRLGENSFLLFLENGGEKLTQWISNTVTRVTNDYNNAHPGDEICLNIDSYMRGSDEPADAFVRSVIGK